MPFVSCEQIRFSWFILQPCPGDLLLDDADGAPLGQRRPQLLFSLNSKDAWNHPKKMLTTAFGRAALASPPRPPLRDLLLLSCQQLQDSCNVEKSCKCVTGSFRDFRGGDRRLESDLVPQQLRIQRSQANLPTSYPSSLPAPRWRSTPRHGYAEGTCPKGPRLPLEPMPRRSISRLGRGTYLCTVPRRLSESWRRLVRMHMTTLQSRQSYSISFTDMVLGINNFSVIQKWFPPLPRP